VLNKLHNINTLDGEDIDNSITISYYPYFSQDIKYQLETDNYFENTSRISYHHGEDCVASKKISRSELESILNLLKKLKLPIYFEGDENLGAIINPCIRSKIVMKTHNLKYEFSWTNEDSMNHEEQLKEILELKELIESLIEVDFSKLQMPYYL
jgi:hypothetical protein